MVDSKNRRKAREINHVNDMLLIPSTRHVEYPLSLLILSLREMIIDHALKKAEQGVVEEG